MNKNKKTILLVEDEAVIALSEAASLRKGGYEVVVTHTGEEAIARVGNEENIDLILMDIDLGRHIDGTQAAERILTNHDIPVVFLSSHTEKAIVDRTKTITNYGFIVKNSGDTVLFACIEMAFKLHDAYRKVHTSEARYRLLFNSVSESIFVHEFADADGLPGKFIEVNDVACQNLGYTREELLNMRVPEIDAPETISGIPGHMDKLRRDKTDLWEGVHVSKNGRRISVEIGNRLFELDGKPAILSTVRDITERKKAMEDLRKSEEQYRILFDNAAEGIMIYDNNLNIANINPRACEIIGYDCAELTGKNIFSLGILHADDYPHAVRNSRLLLSGIPVGKNRYRLMRKDGGIVMCDFSGAILRDEAGAIVSVISIIIDVTEQVKAEEALTISAGNYREIFNASNDAIFVHEVTGAILDVNKTMCDLFGYTHDEAVQLNVRDISLGEFPYSQNEAERLIKTAFEKGPQLFEWQCRKKSGALFWTEVSLKRAVISGQERILAFVRDITERKQTEQVLRETEEKYRTILENIEDGYYDVDSKGNLTFFNDSMCQILGYPQEEMMGMNYRQYTDKENAKKIFKTFNEVYKTGEPAKEFDYQVIRKDGAKRYLEVSVSLKKNSSGNPIGFHGISRDITERKRDEEKIKNLLAEKELVLKEVHHRIKNDMNTVMSLLSLQADTLTEPSAISALNDARSRVDSMSVLYDKLYRSESLREMSIKEYLPSLVDEIVANFPDRNAVEIKKEFGDFILDVKRLQPLGIIVNEILTNIMKHAFTGGRNGLIKVSATRTGNHVSLVIQDNGSGMPESIDFENSTGLGLVLVGQLTRQLQGTIRIEREKGTKIILEFEI